jgi:hypothetical protein
MSPEGVPQAWRERLSVAHTQITFDVPDPSHTGNHRAHGRVFEDEPQGQFGQIHPVW